MNQHVDRRALLASSASATAALAAAGSAAGSQAAANDLPVGEAIAMAPSAEVQIPREQLLLAYSEWLHFERQMLMRDMFPGHDMHEMMRYVPANTRAGTFHFPLRNDPHSLTWETMPSPATRALPVMTAAGVDLYDGEYHWPESQPSKLVALEAAFNVEWNKLRALEPEHGAAERRYFDQRAKLVKPEMRETTQEEIEAVKKMTIAELRDSPLSGAAQEYAEALRAYNKAEWAIRKATGFTKIDRAYQRQHDRVSRAANAVLRHPGGSLDDLAVKVRVHRTWEFDGSDFDYIMDDIARVARKRGLAVS
ncbi:MULTISPECIES: hypothetical protein [unclassified Mesorhizobium]|uniref:hypothetical protein n=1 Tax=unclassified Mesorhizobium TaxID=325217 RepID=UPI001093D755|nr:MULTISPECIES: hypothetical protein [unclassified Mesorhizobium]TGS47512.1 hypothetical protein EN825_00635 [Mesorhizobium sp. M8A.F.Ca.ET.182.01.1.1]TGS84198.1 hypothetical protein EN824_07490 [Mesorhizobium sp. M8A.F.Ca.ET.181.01.1.1]